MRKEKVLSPRLFLSPSSPHPPWVSPGKSYFENTGSQCVKGSYQFQLSSDTRYRHNGWELSFFYLHGRCSGSKGSLARHRLSQVSHASKNIINPIMREILMRCALKFDSGVINRAILPVVESWSWTEACSVAESERKCCYACRSCSHLCLNQWLYIICFFLQRAV